MTIDEYISTVKERLIDEEIVVSFHIVRERTTPNDAHLRVRVVLIDENHLEFSEYVRLAPDSSISPVTYSYHWSDANHSLICRWDNALHYPTLPNFPHHMHRGEENNVESTEPIHIFAVLDTIRRELING